MKTFEINGIMIGEGCEPFVIAEAGINHNGNIELAKKMVLIAKECNVDAIKFQTFHAEEFIQDETITYTYMSQGKEVTESMLEMFKRNEFTENEWEEIKQYCDDNGIVFLATPQNESDLRILERIGVKAIKVGSDDFVNIPLIINYSKVGLPMLLSCGMANGKEIEQTISTVKKNNQKPITLFLCTSQYPTPPEDVNISKLITLKKKYPDVILGLSDHTQGSEAAIMAVALGAKVFEKHFTLSHDMPGPDHWFSANPTELKNWVSSIRTANDMVGRPELEPTKAENLMRIIAHRSITAINDIGQGELLSDYNIGMRRPGDGLPASDWDVVIGKKAIHKLPKGTQITLEDIYE